MGFHKKGKSQMRKLGEPWFPWQKEYIMCSVESEVSIKWAYRRYIWEGEVV